MRPIQIFIVSQDPGARLDDLVRLAGGFEEAISTGNERRRRSAPSPAGSTQHTPRIARDSSPSQSARASSTLLPLFTRRQLEVLCLFDRYRSVQQVARYLRLNPGTIRDHLWACFRKLGVNSQAGLLELLDGPHRLEIDALRAAGFDNQTDGPDITRLLEAATPASGTPHPGPRSRA